MCTAESRRPAGHGFANLIDDRDHRPLKNVLKPIEDSARAAREFAEHSRALDLDALWMEENQEPERAVQARRSALIDHRMACSRLADLALSCARLLRWAALDWRPSPDVAGSGLTEGELRCLCAVFGTDHEQQGVR